MFLAIQGYIQIKVMHPAQILILGIQEDMLI